MESKAVAMVNGYFPKVTSVIDARRAITVEITPRDAKNGVKKSHQACALARACQRSLNVDGALIMRSRAYLVRGRKAIRYAIPGTVFREIVSFDRGTGMTPGTYHLGPVPPSNAQGRWRGGRYKGRKNPKAMPRPYHKTAGIRVAGSEI